MAYYKNTKTEKRLSVIVELHEEVTAHEEITKITAENIVVIFI